MDNFILHNPTRIVFGAGVVDSTGQEVKEWGRKAFIVTGKTAVRRFGILDRVIKSLKSVGIESVVYDQIEPNPRTKSIDEAAIVVRKNQCDFIIGLGGGSPMDAAKGIAALATDEGSIWDYIKSGPGPHRPIRNALPVMTIPTFAGSGSEVNAYGVVTHWDLRQKAVFASNLLYPKVAIVDPALTQTVPPGSTGEGGIDMLCHLLESYFTGNDASPVQDRLTESLVSIVVENLGKAIHNGNDLEARTALSWTSTLALSGYIDSGREGSFPLHWIEHALSGHYDIAHGRGLAILLPRLVEFTLASRPIRYAQLVKRVFGPHVVGTGRSHLEAAHIFHQELIKWMDGVHMYSSLKDFGIDGSRFEKMADDTIHLYGKGRSYLENPRRITKEGIIEILTRSLEASDH